MKISLDDYNATHTDFRGVWTTERTDLADWGQIRESYLGKRTLMDGGGLLIEGLGLEILDLANSCDHGHQTCDEIRSLPIGGGGNVLVCKKHYNKEMEFRRERISCGIPFDLPSWEKLTLYLQELK